MYDQITTSVSQNRRFDENGRSDSEMNSIFTTRLGKEGRCSFGWQSPLIFFSYLKVRKIPDHELFFSRIISRLLSLYLLFTSGKCSTGINLFHEYPCLPSLFSFRHRTHLKNCRLKVSLPYYLLGQRLKLSESRL